MSMNVINLKFIIGVATKLGLWAVKIRQEHTAEFANRIIYNWECGFDRNATHLFPSSTNYK